MASLASPGTLVPLGRAHELHRVVRAVLQKGVGLGLASQGRCWHLNRLGSWFKATPAWREIVFGCFPHSLGSLGFASVLPKALATHMN